MKSLSYLLFLGATCAALEISYAKEVVVGSEDTVYGIAYNNGIPTRTLIAANKLKPPYTLNPGQVLIIPGPSEHIVGDAETLQSISEEYGVNIDALAQENSLQAPFFVNPGDRLSIPSRDTAPLAEALKLPAEDISSSSLAPLPLIKTAQDSYPLKTPQPTPFSPSSSALPDDLAQELAREKESKAEKTEASPKDGKKPVMGNLAEKAKKVGAVGAGSAALLSSKAKDNSKKDVEQKEVAKKESPQDKKDSAKQVSNELTFSWPVNGKVVGQFSKGGQNDGIDIEVSEGTIVKAAADGTVMYSGNKLKGFGNLLLIKHKDGWVTAYAHNSSLLVGKGDKVKQGDKIAKSGIKEDSGASQLHFEIRKVKQPIDPLTKLSQ